MNFVPLVGEQLVYGTPEDKVTYVGLIAQVTAMQQMLMCGVDDLSVPPASFTFRLAKPLNPEDARKGAFCTKCGHWAPAHRITYWNGQPYFDLYAPRPERLKEWPAWLT